MTHSHYVEAIQELVDGTLGAIRRAELEQHLETCPGCRALLADLQRVHDDSAALPDLPPPDGAWLQIAGRLRQEGRVRDDVVEPARTRRWQPAWLALAAALVLAVGAAMYAVLPHRSPATAPSAPAATTAAAPNAPGNAAPQASVESVQSEVEQAQAQYEKAIADLEKVARQHQQALDPQTARTFEKNLAITDQAIAESRAAVHQEPTNVAARESLFDSLRQKVALLQDTISIVNEMRKGNAAGAAEVLNKS